MKDITTNKKKDINVSFIAFTAIFAVLALSAVIAYWVGGDAEWVSVYQMVMRWLVLPLSALVASYAGTIKKAPKGLMWGLPFAFGLGISSVEFATLSVREMMMGEEWGGLSVVLVLMGAFSSLFGFTFAKMDRKEKARAMRAEKLREAKAESKAEPVSKPEPSENDYNPGEEFIPDENDTWADKILAEEGFGEVKVDYAEHDADFSIDAPEAEGCDSYLEADAVEADAFCETDADEVEGDSEIAADEISDEENAQESETSDEAYDEETDVAEDIEAEAESEREGDCDYEEDTESEDEPESEDGCDSAEEAFEPDHVDTEDVVEDEDEIESVDGEVAE